MSSRTLAVVFAAALQVPQSPLVATAGAPRLIDTGPAGTNTFMTEARYLDFCERTGRSSPIFVEIKKKPAGLSARARYGINLALRGKIVSWMIDGGEADGYVLFADWNGNGDLTDDTPMRFAPEDGKPTIRVHREERDGDVVYPVSMKLMLDWVVPPLKTEKEIALKIFNTTMRAGEVTPPGHKPVRFELTGTSGYYSGDSHRVSFDLNHDGAFDAETEVFRVRERYVNIGDTSYEFIVDTHGDRLTLSPLAGFRPSRVTLTVGSPAPDFSFTTMDGHSRKLSEYRGKVVLLDFWGAWCKPCAEEAPKVVALHQRYRDRGLEVIGIDTIDTREAAMSFIETYKTHWTQTMEPDKGPIQTLYRIGAFPSYFLIGADGTIKLSIKGEADEGLDRALRALLP